MQFDDDFETLNGFLISRLEHIPGKNEAASVDYRGYHFQIIGMDDNIIAMVRVTPVAGA